jgi:predicted transcriptional regulator YheO
MNESREERANAILDHYVRMAEVLGTMFKPVLEVVVHDP